METALENPSPLAPPSMPAPSPAAAPSAAGNDEPAWLEAERKKFTAMQSPLAAASKANAAPIPQLGKMEQAPAAPKPENYREGAMGFASAMAILGAIGSRFVRMPGNAALKSFAGAMDGFQKGNLEAYEQAVKEWDSNAKKTIENNNLVMQKYKAALQSRQLNIDQQMSQVQLIAAQYQDPIMYQYAAAKNYTGVANAVDKGSAAGEQADKWRTALMERHDEGMRDAMQKAEFWLSPEGQRVLAIPPGQAGALTADQKDNITKLVNWKMTSGRGGATGAGISPDTARRIAEQVLAGDTTARQNIGRGIQGAADIRTVNEAITEVAKERGMTGADIAQAQAEFQGLKAGERTLANRQANIETAVREADNMIPLALAASDASKRSGVVTWNKAQQRFEVETGDPNYARFVAATNSLINIYGRAISGGGKGTVSDLEHAREILNPSMPAPAYRAAVEQMQLEMQAALKSPGQVRRDMRERGGQESGAAAPAPKTGGTTTSGVTWSVEP